MAKNVNFGYTDTATGNTVDIKPTIPSLNWKADYRVVDDGPTEAVVTNITAPISQPEKFRFAHNNITDIYRGTGIDPTMYYASRRGTKFLVQMTNVARVTDSADTSYEALLPFSCHIVVSVPNAEIITSDMVMNEIYRMLGGLWTTTATGRYNNVDGLLRGALLPSTL